MLVVKILTVVGSRPQFIKSVPVSRQFKTKGIREILVHTGQHYDAEMSGVFFRELSITAPAHNLGVRSGTHAEQTGKALRGIEALCLRYKPDRVLIYGDTNATLSGALAAAKLRIPIAHVEAGLRSFDRSMPEEINRIVADSVSEYLFCPTQAAVRNLKMEANRGKIYLVGDVMYDASLYFKPIADKKSRVLSDLSLKPRSYVLVTIHRDFNVDDPVRLKQIVEGCVRSKRMIVFPLHPRTQKQLLKFGFMGRLEKSSLVRIVKPLGYLDMLSLESHAERIMTDSGGVQKEAYFFRVPCITIRPSTEWVETVQCGWNCLVDAKAEKIAAKIYGKILPRRKKTKLYGDGTAAQKIVRMIESSLS